MTDTNEETKKNDQQEVSDPPSKPRFPSDYIRPKVWTPDDLGGMFGSINQPTAGARFEQTLPRGNHDIQLYSLGTPNGVKVTILLEEICDIQGIEYDAFNIDIMAQEQFGSDFVAINPNSKIPVMIDTSFDPPLRVFESGNILKYLAEKYSAFLPTDTRLRVETFNWLFWNIGSAPYIGGCFGHFYCYAPVEIKYAVDRYAMETKRLLDVLDKQLEGKAYIVGDEITIADFAIWPWIRCIDIFYKAGDFLQLNSNTNIARWSKSIEERPAVKRGIRVNGFGDDAVKERHSKNDF
jgi:GSH-dependent disulfide-bond oxidoreductase